jgi:DNA-binding beta-propeller fold protein YncE
LELNGEINQVNAGVRIIFAAQSLPSSFLCNQARFPASLIRQQPFTTMNYLNHLSRFLFVAGIGMFAAGGLAQTASAANPYKIVNTAQTMGAGGIDYVYADNDARRLYVPRGNQVLVFDLDTLKSAGSITNARARGAAVDPKSHHGFSSSSPVVMWDSKTLEIIKTIDVQGRPDGILFEPLTERIYVFSHSAPNVTVIDGKDGSIVGTIDLGGAPEQAQSDGQGHLYVDIEDKDNIAVVDVKTLKVTAHYDLGGKGGGPGGLGLDAKNHILFAMCHEPATCVILNADDGKILATLPIGNGTDGGGFNPATMEAFSSQGDGTLTIIKEASPTSFEVEQTVQTKSRAKTCTLDTKNNQIILITTERPATPPAAATANATTAAATPQVAAATSPAGTNQSNGNRRGGRGGNNNDPAMLDILVVGK